VKAGAYHVAHEATFQAVGALVLKHYHGGFGRRCYDIKQVVEAVGSGGFRAGGVSDHSDGIAYHGR
jgi:hypothetical protein